MKRLLGIVLAAALSAPAFGQTANLPPLITKAPVAVKSTNCTAGNCSGWFGMIGVTDFTQNFLANGLNSSTSDVGLTIGGGYQLWNGPWFAGLQAEVGYEFVGQGISVPGSHFTGDVVAHIGYNFFANASAATATPSGTTTPGQNPFAGIVPANLLQNTTPYFSAGGCFRHGITEACAGVGAEAALASSWSVAFDYTNMPTQQKQPDTQVFMLHLKRHFSF